MLKILIADDHFIVREGLRRVLEDDPDIQVVDEATNGIEAIAAYRKSRPDVIIIDLKMPAGGGLEAIRCILDEDDQAKVLVLTSLDDDRDIRNAMAAGARGCLLKSNSGPNLIPALKAIAEGGHWLPFQPSTTPASRRTLPDEQLTDREVEILSLLALGEANKEIGHVLGITENTVKSHVKNIREKLGARDRTEAVTLAIRRGIIDLAP